MLVYTVGTHDCRYIVPKQDKLFRTVVRQVDDSYMHPYDSLGISFLCAGALQGWCWANSEIKE